jgi:hypothetical protein
MRRDRDGRTALNGLVAALLGLAVVVALVAGLRSLYLAQTGELRPPPPRNPGLLQQPELPRDEVQVRACVDAEGATVYSSDSCASGADAGERAVEVTTIELAPAAPPAASGATPAK